MAANSASSSSRAEERKFAIFGSHLKERRHRRSGARIPPELDNNNTNSSAGTCTNIDAIGVVIRVVSELANFKWSHRPQFVDVNEKKQGNME